MFFFYMPNAILIAAAVIPALWLLRFVYKHDRLEAEPPQLLLSLVLQGVFATTIAKLLERAGMWAVDLIAAPNTVLNSILLYFGVVAFAEEGAKYFLLRRRTWGIRDFNCRFDGVVYAAFVSLGFALWENIGYVFMYGMGTALIRAVTAVPGHACFGVFMGCWYGQGFAWYRRGDDAKSKVCRTVAVVLPALLHGAYDFLAAMTGEISEWYFVAFVALLFFVTFRVVGRLSREDYYI